jgi:radial spoke head protein 4A
MNETEIPQLLSSIKSQKCPEANLYEHFEKLFKTKMEMNDDAKFIDFLEDISIRIKKTGHYIDKKDCEESLHTYLNDFCKNLKAKKMIINDLPRKEDDDNPKVGYVPDYHSLFQQFEWVGLSVGEKESIMLTGSLRNLSYNKGLTSAVFWGKILGREKDYYIAEVVGGEYAGKFYILIFRSSEPRARARKAWGRWC